MCSERWTNFTLSETTLPLVNLLGNTPVLQMDPRYGMAATTIPKRVFAINHNARMGICSFFLHLLVRILNRGDLSKNCSPHFRHHPEQSRASTKHLYLNFRARSQCPPNPCPTPAGRAASTMKNPTRKVVPHPLSNPLHPTLAQPPEEIGRGWAQGVAQGVGHDLFGRVFQRRIRAEVRRGLGPRKLDRQKLRYKTVCVWGLDAFCFGTSYVKADLGHHTGAIFITTILRPSFLRGLRRAPRGT